MTKLTENSMTTLKVALAIAAAAWWLGGLNSDVQTVKLEVAEIKADVKSLLKQSSFAGPVRGPGSVKCAVNPGSYGSR